MPICYLARCAACACINVTAAIVYAGSCAAAATSIIAQHGLRSVRRRERHPRLDCPGILLLPLDLRHLVLAMTRFRFRWRWVAVCVCDVC